MVYNKSSYDQSVGKRSLLSNVQLTRKHRAIFGSHKISNLRLNPQK